MMAVFCIRKFDLHQHELQNTQAYVHICIQIQHVHVCSYLKKKKEKKMHMTFDMWECVCASISPGIAYCSRHAERLLASKQFNMSNKHTVQWAAGEQSERRKRWQEKDRDERRWEVENDRTEAEGGEQVWIDREGKNRGWLKVERGKSYLNLSCTTKTGGCVGIMLCYVVKWLQLQWVTVKRQRNTSKLF